MIACSCSGDGDANGTEGGSIPTCSRGGCCCGGRDGDGVVMEIQIQETCSRGAGSICVEGNDHDEVGMPSVAGCCGCTVLYSAVSSGSINSVIGD